MLSPEVAQFQLDERQKDGPRLVGGAHLSELSRGRLARYLIEGVGMRARATILVLVEGGDVLDVGRT
jgi:hypothetical protein